MKTGEPRTMFRKLSHSIFGVLLILSIASCGGGGGSPGTTGGTGTSGTTAGSSTSASDPKITVKMTDALGTSINSLSGGQSGTVRATVTTATGGAVANAVVKFTTSDSALIEFTPESASALTDASGIAVITVKPKDFTSAGALTIQAESVVASKTAQGTVNIAVGAAPLTIGALSFSPVPSGALPAFSAVTLNIPVTSNGQAVSTVSGLTLTSQCAGDGTATLVLGSLANGIQSATYTNNGCLRGTDLIAASIGTSSQSISLAVDSANIGAIQFAGTDISGSSIVLKGSGGLGRKESAVVTFKVVDQNNNGLAGVNVSFRATTTTGGLTVLPASGTTNSNGQVTTTVSSGTIPTPVRVIAEAVRNGRTISGLSDTLTVSTGLPIQRSMSLSVDKYNIEGWGYDGEEARVTVMMADQYGNPISDNTAINFVTEGGAVGTSAQGACTTSNGGCTVSLKSQNFRPINGRVTVLAYAQGIENFTDSNGDGQYSCTNFTDVNGAVPSTYRPLMDICVSGGEPFTPSDDMGDPFLDAGSLATTTGVLPGTTLDGSYHPANGDLPFPYNSSTYSATGNGRWGINYIRQSTEIVFSGSTPTLIRQVCTGDTCRDWNSSTDGDASVIQGLSGATCSSQVLTFRLIDLNNNPLPYNTVIASADADKIAPQTIYPALVPSTNQVGGTSHSLSVKPESTCAPGSFTIRVTTPKGNGRAFFFRG